MYKITKALELTLLSMYSLGPLGLNFLFFSTKRKFNKEKHDSRGGAS